MIKSLNTAHCLRVLYSVLFCSCLCKLLSPSLQSCLFHLITKGDNDAKIRWPSGGFVCFVGCFTSQQHASVSLGRICSDKCMCCHTEIEVADHTFYLTQSQKTDTELTSTSADSIMPGSYSGMEYEFLSYGYDSTQKKIFNTRMI